MSQCPLCYPFRKTTKPLDRPKYEYEYGRHWYRCNQDGKHWAVSTNHDPKLSWDAWKNLGWEIQLLLWRNEKDAQVFEDLVVRVKREHGHFVLTLEHVK